MIMINYMDPLTATTLSYPKDMKSYIPSIKELLKRPLIRNDHDEEHLNKMTADESKSSTL